MQDKWSRFNAVIVSRHGCKELYDKNLRILQHLPYPRVCISNSTAFGYMVSCVEHFRGQYDWVINIDDDAFITDFDALYHLMVAMEEGDYDICGMADGLTFTPRDVFNPASMNPFFNVIQMRTFCSKFPTKEDLAAPYRPELINMVPLDLYHPEMWGKTAASIDGSEFPVGYEPYYPFFYAILPKAKIMWLYGRSYTFDQNAPRESVIIPDEPRRKNTWPLGKKGITFPDDPWTTVLYTHEMKPFVLHTWYARFYNPSDEPDPTLPLIPNAERIDRIFNLACKFNGMIV